MGSWSALLKLAIFGATLRIAAPLIYAALATTMTERGGVVNIGVEGTMLLGCFIAVVGSSYWGPWVGVLLAAILGGLIGVLHAYLTVTIRANQIISGTAINILAIGVPNLIIPAIWPGYRAGTPPVTGLPTLTLPAIANLPVLGPIIGQQSPLVYLALILVPVVHLVLFKTRFGLRLRACGEHPRAADTVGISVSRVRYAGVIASGILAGLGGALLALSVGQYFPMMTQGRGFIGMAAMIFGNWKPGGALVACLIFGYADAFQAAAQSVGVLSISPRFLQSLPYLLTLIALAGLVAKSVAPAASGKPYEKG